MINFFKQIKENMYFGLNYCYTGTCNFFKNIFLGPLAYEESIQNLKEKAQIYTKIKEKLENANFQIERPLIKSIEQSLQEFPEGTREREIQKITQQLDTNYNSTHNSVVGEMQQMLNPCGNDRGEHICKRAVEYFTEGHHHPNLPNAKLVTQITDNDVNFTEMTPQDFTLIKNLSNYMSSLSPVEIALENIFINTHIQKNLLEGIFNEKVQTYINLIPHKNQILKSKFARLTDANYKVNLQIDDYAQTDLLTNFKKDVKALAFENEYQHYIKTFYPKIYEGFLIIQNPPELFERIREDYTKYLLEKYSGLEGETFETLRQQMIQNTSLEQNMTTITRIRDLVNDRDNLDAVCFLVEDLLGVIEDVDEITEPSSVVNPTLASTPTEELTLNSAASMIQTELSEERIQLLAETADLIGGVIASMPPV